MPGSILGVGLGYRSPIRKDILQHVDDLDFLEVITDSFFSNQSALQALCSLIPCIPHSLNLSVGTAPDADYLSNVKQIVELMDPPWHSDHLSFTRVRGLSIGHLAPVPFVEEALHTCVRNIQQIQQAIDVPFAVENITMPFYWPNNTMEEPEFLKEIIKRTGCHLLLDLENARINAANHDGDAKRFLDELPLEQVIQVHLAGGRRGAGLEHDTHSEPIQAKTWSLLEYLCELTEPKGVLIERDSNFPPFDEIMAEVRRARAILERVVA